MAEEMEIIKKQQKQKKAKKETNKQHQQQRTTDENTLDIEIVMHPCTVQYSICTSLSKK